MKWLHRLKCGFGDQLGSCVGRMYGGVTTVGFLERWHDKAAPCDAP
ncbi:MAG: hypothetical protein ACP5I8_15725 [Phycisphaerae bacterium]